MRTVKLQVLSLNSESCCVTFELQHSDLTRKLTTILLLVVVSLVIPTAVHAQTTSISNLNAPSSGTVGSDVTVSVVVTYSGNNGYYLRVYNYDIDAAALVTGTPESPDCASRQGTNEANGAICVLVPQHVPGYTGSIDVTFVLTFSTPKVYDLYAGADFASVSGASGAQIVSGSFSKQDFSIVVSAPGQSAAGTVSGTVSISNFQYPTTVLLGQQSIVSFTVSFSGFTPGVTYLVVGVQNADGSNWASGSVVSSSPDNCPEPTEQDRGLAVCFYQPVEPQGSENLAFSLTVNSAGTFSSYGAEAEPALRSTSCSSDWCFGQSQYTSSFTIQAVTSLPPSSTMSTTGVSASDATMYFEILMLGLVIFVVGVIAYHVYGSKRRKETVQTKLDSVMVQTQQQPPVQQRPLPIQTPREIVSSKNMMFCNQCGAHIIRDSKFCTECGAKQE